MALASAHIRQITSTVRSDIVGRSFRGRPGGPEAWLLRSYSCHHVRTSLIQQEMSGKEDPHDARDRVLPIDIIHKIDEYTDRHDSKIDLLPQFRLNGKLCGGELRQLIPRLHLFISNGNMVLYVLSPRATFNLVVDIHSSAVGRLVSYCSAHALRLLMMESSGREELRKKEKKKKKNKTYIKEDMRSGY